MAHATVNPGICGFRTRLEVVPEADGRCLVRGESACSHVQRLLASLGPVDPYGEISYQPEAPRTLAAAAAVLPHPACPVPCALLKALEVAAGLALPADVSVVISE